MRANRHKYYMVRLCCPCSRTDSTRPCLFVRLFAWVSLGLHPKPRQCQLDISAGVYFSMWLQQAQHSERVYLSKAFQRVGDLERRRVGALQEVFSSMVQLYRCGGVWCDGQRTVCKCHGLRKRRTDEAGTDE